MSCERELKNSVTDSSMVGPFFITRAREGRMAQAAGLSDHDRKALTGTNEQARSFGDIEGLHWVGGSGLVVEPDLKL